MSRIFMFAHGGSGNHGCEAIVRATKDILNRDDLTLISGNPAEDKRYGLNDICSVILDRNDAFAKKDVAFWLAYLALKIKKDYIPMDKLEYRDSFAHIQRGDIALSIGGDNYCYANVQKYVMLHDLLKKRGAKTVLWGCSVEPDVVARADIAKDLARYDFITARETISYEALKAVNPNTYLIADPAFVLQPKEVKLPEGFAAGNTVGINLSPMAIERECVPGIAFENYKRLIMYIIERTNMQVALIPHVVWPDGDDRIPLKKLYEEFKSTGRVVLIEDQCCSELKYVISKCRFFIGARTHATIAAYSSNVPTLVLGYSIKSRGIARDLFGTEENYVVPVQKIEAPNAILNAFLFVSHNERQISDTLHKKIPEFQTRARRAAEIILK